MEELLECALPNIVPKEVQEGVIRLIQYDIILNDYAAWIEQSKKKIIIPRKELDLVAVKGSLNQYIGRKVKFVLIRYDQKRQIFIGSCKCYKLQKQNELIERLRNGEIFDARISRIVYFGAYLDIEGISVIIRNRDFANDYTNIADVLNEGQKLKVKLKKVTKNGNINVQAVHKYVNNTNIPIENFKPQTVVSGIIRSVKPWACFVKIAPNIDAICPVPSSLTIKEGMEVAFKINQVKVDNGRIRGKIVKVIK